MRTILFGPRDFHDYAMLEAAIDESAFVITEVVSGGASGADRLGELWGERNGVPVKRFPADWDRYGKRAGPIRNQAMGEYAEAGICVWDGVSRGTGDMLGRLQGMRRMWYCKRF